MPRVPAHRERERASGMLQGGMRTAHVARAINCNVELHQERTVSAQTVRNRLKEAGLRACDVRIHVYL
jgi:predicted urease superfamily metal-dependent hydrolase